MNKKRKEKGLKVFKNAREKVSKRDTTIWGQFLSSLKEEVNNNSKRDTAEKKRALQKELVAKIEKLLDVQIQSPEKSHFMDDEDDGEFAQLIEKEVRQKEDRAIWKEYSKYGGISDTLMNIKKSVENPSVNAFEFDEDEGMYIIFITLNNTYISRLTALCSEMCNKCNQIEKNKMEDSELNEKRKQLLEIYETLCSDRKELSEKPESFQQQYKTISSVKRDAPEKELRKLESDLDSYEEKRKDYDDKVKAYQERLAFFEEKCEQQKSYEFKYGALLEKLTELGKICEEAHPFHMLTISPKGEEKLGLYMDTAHKFNKWTQNIATEYPL